MLFPQEFRARTWRSQVRHGLRGFPTSLRFAVACSLTDRLAQQRFHGIRLARHVWRDNLIEAQEAGHIAGGPLEQVVRPDIALDVLLNPLHFSGGMMRSK